MIKNVAIKNFRAYKDLKLSNLKRINVIVGENASGKTALLEALYLGLGAHPELYFRLRTQRGLGDRIPLPFTKSAGSDLFFDADDPTVISTVGTPGITRRTTIFYDEKAPVSIPLDQQIQDTATAPALAFRWKDHGKKAKTIRAYSTKGGPVAVGDPRDPISTSYFSSAFALNPVETAERFHRLDEKDAAGPLVAAMQAVFPIIEELSIGTYAGAPMMYARLKGQKGKRQLGLVSSGINKLLSILAAIFDHAGRVVLVDEIENGLYYDTMLTAWDSLFRFSQQNRTQLFISTHSLETLRKLIPIMKEHEDQFCLLQTKFEDGESRIRYVAGLDFESALEEGVEVR